MKSKSEHRATKLMIDQCFSKVAELPFVVNKWISIKVIYDLILQYVKSDFASSINTSYFKRILIASDKVSYNLTRASSHRYYY